MADGGRTRFSRLDRRVSRPFRKTSDIIDGPKKNYIKNTRSVHATGFLRIIIEWWRADRVESVLKDVRSAYYKKKKK